MTEKPRSPTITIPDDELRAMRSAPEPSSAEEQAALDRLIAIAHSDTGQARRVANFLLAWWNAGTCGGFDFTDLWAVDLAIREDMLLVAGLIARIHSYPDTLGHGRAFERIVIDWRPALVK